MVMVSRVTPSRMVPDSSGVAIDPSSNTVVSAIPVGDTPTSVATEKGAVWVLNANEETISEVDPQRRAKPAPRASSCGCW